ncbi:uncharacterized protein LOC119370129 [Jatropha curcas]|uniref:uncharacterized protein LOC119370129 n=1 Tax=Jatropha curcas TaxID=180498 RepID=UPI001895491F|nr:uncharacterized protein LOC119370129 [Jatropha curcas]
MKDNEKVKDYIDRVMKIVNQIRLLGEELEEKRIVEKVMVTLPEKFEAKISSLEDTWDMSQISLNVLSNALQAVKQRKAYREEETFGEKALVVTQQPKMKKNFRKIGGKAATDKKNTKNEENFKKKIGGRTDFHLVHNCKKTNHTENYC